MTCLNYLRIACLAGGVLLLSASSTLAAAPVSGFDAMLYETYPYGKFVFGAFDPGVGGYTANGLSSFTIDAQDTGDPNVGAFGGIGGHYLGPYGSTFDPNDYQLELKLKPLANNAASRIRAVLTQFDGGTSAEEWSFAFDFDPNGTAFTTLTRDLTSWGTNGGDGYLSPPTSGIYNGTGNGIMDFNAGGASPKGLYEIELQSVYGSADRLNVEIESLKVVPKPTVAEPEVARFDGHSGITYNWGDFDTSGTVTQSSDPNSSVLAIDISSLWGGIGGTALRTPLINLDATTAGIEVTAKLGPNNTADHISVILKEADGDDDASGQGGEEWVVTYKGDGYGFFDSSDFSTVTIPLANAIKVGQAGGFTYDGDGIVADSDPNTLDFGLYEMQIVCDLFTAGKRDLDIDIESVKIVALAADNADFDEDNDVDGADFLVWQRNSGMTGGATLANGDANGDGNVDGSDLAIWQDQFGSTSMVAVANAVPEPGTALLLVLGWSCCCGRRFAGRRLH